MRSMKNSNALGALLVFVVVLLCANTAAAAPVDQGVSPTNIFAACTSTPADSIFGVTMFVLGVTAAIFVVVGSLLLYCVVKFKKRKDDDGREPAQVYGSNQVEHLHGPSSLY